MTRIRIKWRQCGAATRLAVLGSALILVPLCGYVFAQVSGFSGFSESISTLADGDSFGADDADDSNQAKSVLASTIKTYTSSAPTITGVATFSGTTRYSVDAGVSATGTGQGDGYDITENVVQVTTITAASAEAVVLPTAAAGAWCFIINDDATDGLKIFPASGDDLGEGIDTVRATDLAAGSNIMFRAYDATNWEEIASGGGAASSGTALFTISGTEDTASKEIARFQNDPGAGNQGADDEVFTSYYIRTTDGVEEIGRISAVGEDISAGDEGTRFDFDLLQDGTLTTLLSLDGDDDQLTIGGTAANDEVRFDAQGASTHGMTAVLGASSYMRLQAASGGSGLIIRGIAKADTVSGVTVSGLSNQTGAVTVAPLRFRSAKRSGTGRTTLAADEPAVLIQNDTTDLLTIDADGDFIFDSTANVVNTTDATETTLITIPTATDTAYHVTLSVVAVETVDHDETASFQMTGTFQNDGGVLTEVGDTVVSHLGSTAWVAAFDVNTTNIRVRVTGAVSTNINWKPGAVEITEVQ